MGYESAIGYLYGLQKHGIKLGLENPARLLSMLGDPQGAFKSIHVAGTNGKGSVSAITASILKEAGMRVGLFTSPHLISFTERIRVDGKEIGEDEVVTLAKEIRNCLNANAPDMTPTFFEFVTAMAFLYFKRKAVDWAVIETGMGGRLDATNVIAPEVSVITRVGIDHKEFLGEDLGRIAGEKAGIIKPGIPVVTCLQEKTVMDVIEKKARETGSALYLEGRDFTSVFKSHKGAGIFFDYTSGGGGMALTGLFLPLRGAYQAENAGLAIRAVTGACGAVSGETIKRGLGNLRWPGRLQFIHKRILIDAAHNPQAAEALAGWLRGRPSRDLILIIGIMADKDMDGILMHLLPLAREIIFTAPSHERAASPELLKGKAWLLGFKSTTAPTVHEAIEMALESEGLILVTGSFYTAGEAMEAVGIKGVLKGLHE